MKKQYKTPKMEVIDIDRRDIITDSTGEEGGNGNDDINID